MAASLLELGCLTFDERQRVDAWLTCEDCLEGEQDNLRAIGWRAVPRLGRALGGLPEVERANLRDQFRASYRLLPSGIQGALSGSGYETRLLAATDAGYRRQAAGGLADVGARGLLRSLVARWYLDRALGRHAAGDDTIPDVALRALYEALTVLKFPLFAGALSDSVVAFLDTVAMVRGGASPWAGDEEVTLSSPAVPGSLVVRRSPDTLWIVAAAEPGRYGLVVGHAGTATGAERTALTVAALRYTAHDTASAPILSIGVDTLRFLALRPGAAEDHFRFDLPAGDSVRARIAWSGPERLALAILRCGAADTLAVVAAGPEPHETVKTFAPAGCWHIGVAGDSLRRTVVVRLQVTTP